LITEEPFSAAARSTSFSMVSWPIVRSPSLSTRSSASVGWLALQALLTRSQHVVAPGGQPVRLDAELARQRLQRFAPQQPQHHLGLFPADQRGWARKSRSPPCSSWLFTAMTGILTPAYSVSNPTGSNGEATRHTPHRGCNRRRRTAACRHGRSNRRPPRSWLKQPGVSVFRLKGLITRSP
jgi:hypothetical protein